MCVHNNAVRAANSDVVSANPLPRRKAYPMAASVLANNLKESLNPESRSLLPKVAFGDFQKRFTEPTMDEGFQDITHVEFQFLGDEEAAKVWGEYWV